MNHIEKRVRADKIAAMDGIMKLLPYLDNEISTYNEKILDLNAYLSTGGVSAVTYDHIVQLSKRSNTTLSPVEKAISEKITLESYRDDLIQVKRRITLSLESLDPFDRQLLSLRYQNHLSYDAIASRMYMSRDTVRRRIQSALLAISL